MKYAGVNRKPALGRIPGRPSMRCRNCLNLYVCLLSIALLGVGAALMPSPDSVKASENIFTDITESAGIRWKHSNGESNDRTLIEPISGGVAFADFDNDGALDIFLVAGGETPRGE